MNGWLVPVMVVFGVLAFVSGNLGQAVMASLQGEHAKLMRFSKWFIPAFMAVALPFWGCFAVWVFMRLAQV